MTVMYSFCLCLPVRLGAIIVSVTCAVESLACLIAALLALDDHKGTLKFMEDLFAENYNLDPCQGLLESFEEDPDTFLYYIIGGLSIHLVVCLLLFIAAFRCNLWLLYPFVGLDFIRLCILSVSLVLLLLIIKTNSLTLGTVIACSIFGGFFMLYLWYQWFCVVSLCQIIREVKRMDQVAPISYPPTVSGKMNMGGAYNSAFYARAGITDHHDRKFYGLPQPTM